MNADRKLLPAEPPSAWPFSIRLNPKECVAFLLALALFVALVLDAL